MKHSELSWKARDGLDIFAQSWEPTDLKAKAVICLVHGHGEHSSRFANVAEAFGRGGYALLAADLRGHGRSGGARGHANSLEDYLDDIDLLLEQARSGFNGLPLILYGHSIGAVLVLNYVLRRKPNVKGVIATSPSLHTSVEEQSVKLLAVKVLGSLFPKISMPSGLETAALSHDKDVIQAYINDPLVHDQISLGLGKIMLDANRWTLAHAREFSLPLLLFHGEADRIAYPSSSIEFAEALRDSGRCTLVLREGAYHELHNESAEKAELFKTMTIWMDARLKE